MALGRGITTVGEPEIPVLSVGVEEHGPRKGDYDAPLDRPTAFAEKLKNMALGRGITTASVIAFATISLIVEEHGPRKGDYDSIRQHHTPSRCSLDRHGPRKGDGWKDEG